MNSPSSAQPSHPGLNGWVEAIIFSVALSVLNITYGLAFQLGAHPVAFIGYAMIFAAMTLLLLTGPGPHWRQIVLHPLSFGIGGGIIAMELTYFMLLNFVTPAEGSLLVRLNVPIAALIGWLSIGRKIHLLGIIGHALIIGAIVWYLPSIPVATRPMAIGLGLACGLIMTVRWFATEFHPWNQSARSIWEKMRLTGLVLLVTSVLSVVLIAGLMSSEAAGLLNSHGALPTPQQLLHAPTLWLGFFSGAMIITTMQYFGFSTVVKIRAENFLAATALIPLITVAFQIGAVALGVLAPVPLDWSVMPSMLVVFAGVLLIIFPMRPAGKAG